MSGENEYEETLVLKAEFGGALDEDEAKRVEAFVSTPHGHAYREGVRTTRAMLSSPAPTPGTKLHEDELPVAETARLRARFEEALRGQGQVMRRQLLGLVLISFGAVAAASTFFGHVLPRFHPKQPGPGEVASLWLFGLASATLFCLYMAYRLRELERAPDLFDRLTGRARSVPRTLAQHLRRLPVVAFFIWFLSRTEGWRRATIGVVGLWVVFALAAHLLRGRERRQRMGMDPELWSWWYGELEKPPPTL